MIGLAQVARRFGDNAGYVNGLRLCFNGASSHCPARRADPVPLGVSRMCHGRRSRGGPINAGLFSGQDGGGAVGAVHYAWPRHCNRVSKRLRLGTKCLEGVTPAGRCKTEVLVGSSSVEVSCCFGRGDLRPLDLLYRRMAYGDS